ncbi:MAG: ABC transporter permease [Dehalococcoidia bacterium]|nr:ABC transporter permease [Dehalococcoidia bacterium]
MPETTVGAMTIEGVRDLEGELRGGVRHWLRSYWLMVRWELLSQRLMLPMLVVVLLMLGAGMALGLGLLFENPSPQQALYISTGATVIPMMTLGLSMLPQLVAQQKVEGTYDYLFSLPIPRMAMYFAGLSVWTVIALPSAVMALAVAAWRYDLELSVSPLAVPAALLVVAVASAVGYSFAHAITNPRLTNVVTQLLIFVVIFFSPVNFPAERLPGWLQAAHEWLPPQHAALVMRGTLTEGLVDGGVGESFAILGAWAVGATLVTAWVLGRRG